MERLVSHKYEPVAGHDDADISQRCQDAEFAPLTQDSNLQSTRLWFLLMFVLLISLNITLWRVSTLNVQQPQHSFTNTPETWSPALEEPDLLTLAPKTMAGAIGQQNPYRGFPSPEIDSAWQRIGEGAPGIRLSEDDVHRLNKSTGHLHKLQGSGVNGEPEYLGMLEVFHLLHCVDALRSTGYRELYRGEVAFPPIANVEAHRIHLDHCADILRESLMCTSDLSVVLFEYDGYHRLPQPDFSTTKVCRNFETVLNWNHVSERRVEWDSLEFPMR